jgi:hypothetical protein
MQYWSVHWHCEFCVHWGMNIVVVEVVAGTPLMQPEYGLLVGVFAAEHAPPSRP